MYIVGLVGNMKVVKATVVQNVVKCEWDTSKHRNNRRQVQKFTKVFTESEVYIAKQSKGIGEKMYISEATIPCDNQVSSGGYLHETCILNSIKIYYYYYYWY